MSVKDIQAVTGAFGFSGKYIARRLLDKGHQVITLTDSAQRANPFAGKVKAYPFNFDSHERLAESLKGVSVLYNTYYVRFNHELFTFAKAVDNSITMFNAAKEAGVERVVHISITNPSEESNLEYFRGKALIEKALMGSGMSYSILRPAVLFGKEDILINNIAWVLRRLPVFGIFGDGKYRLQPIYVDDLAVLATKQGEKHDNVIIDAIGPETFAYKGLVEVIGTIIGEKRPIISVAPAMGSLAGRVIGLLVNDVFITRDEIKGLMADLLYVDSPPAGETRLTAWAGKHSNTIGRKYASELARRLDRKSEFRSY